MIETGVPRTWVQQYAVRSVVRAPPGTVMVAPPEIPRNAWRVQSEGPGEMS
jgi:hypothetical protein